jgi:hypothetical protein
VSKLEADSEVKEIIAYEEEPIQQFKEEKLHVSARVITNSPFEMTFVPR